MPCVTRTLATTEEASPAVGTCVHSCSPPLQFCDQALKLGGGGLLYFLEFEILGLTCFIRFLHALT